MNSEIFFLCVEVCIHIIALLKLISEYCGFLLGLSV